MDWQNLFLMRSEISLAVLLLVILMMEIAQSGKGKVHLPVVLLLLFALHTVLAFLPLPEGQLFGGMFRTDSGLQLMKNVLNVGVLLVLLQADAYVRSHWVGNHRMLEFYFLLFSSLLGMYFMLSAGDFLMFYLGLELASLPVAALAAYELSRQRSAEAGIKLVLSAALASGVLLFGISLLYAAGGSIYFEDLLKGFSPNALTTLGFIFFFSGLAFKISLVPFHLWTADVYEGAPISVTSYLSVVSKGAAVFVLGLLLMRLFPLFAEMWREVLVVLAILTMSLGNLFALRQTNMKRFLAFSSIAQAGFILLGLLAGTPEGMTSVVYFVLIYAFSNLAAFGVVQVIALQTGKESMEDYEGLYRSNPRLSLVMLLALFSLAGVPPVAGFFGKFFLFMSAAGAGYYGLVLVAVVNVVISLYYYLLVVRAMFLRRSERAMATFSSDLPMRISLVACVGGILFLGLYSPVYEWVLTLLHSGG